MMSKQSNPVAKASHASKFPHEEVIEEISLSQAAITKAGASVESDSFPPPDDCDESVTALLELNDTSTGSNQENLSVWKAKLARANAYQILMPDYQDLTSVAEYDAETTELAASKIRTVTEVRALVLAKQAAKQGTNASVSLPETDQAKVKQKTKFIYHSQKEQETEVPNGKVDMCVSQKNMNMVPFDSCVPKSSTEYQLSTQDRPEVQRYKMRNEK